VTNCIELGVKKNDHGQLYYTYRMAPGQAWRIDDVGREHKAVEVSAADARKAEAADLIRFINNKTVVVFKLGDVELAQPLPIKENAHVGKVKQAAPQRRPAASRAPRQDRPVVREPAAPVAAQDGGRDAEAAKDRGGEKVAAVPAPVRREAPRRARYEPL
jgi:hypothetical protein